MGEISWGDFLTVIFIAAVLYYAFIFLRFWLPHMGKTGLGEVHVDSSEEVEGFDLSVMEQFSRGTENDEDDNNPMKNDNIAENNNKLAENTNKESDNSTNGDNLEQDEESEDNGDLDNDDLFPEDVDYAMPEMEIGTEVDFLPDGGFSPDNSSPIDFGNNVNVEENLEVQKIGAETPVEPISKTEPEINEGTQNNDNKEDLLNMDFSKFLD